MNQNDWINLLQFKSSGILFGNVSFTEPARFEFFLPPFGSGGLYAIMVPDNSAKPRSFRAVYFGESGDLAKRVCLTHEKYVDWVKEAGTAHDLYVSFHAMSGSKDERVALESRLVAQYQPACNDTFNPLRSLFGGGTV